MVNYRIGRAKPSGKSTTENRRALPSFCGRSAATVTLRRDQPGRSPHAGRGSEAVGSSASVVKCANPLAPCVQTKCFIASGTPRAGESGGGPPHATTLRVRTGHRQLRQRPAGGDFRSAFAWAPAREIRWNSIIAVKSRGFFPMRVVSQDRRSAASKSWRGSTVVRPLNEAPATWMSRK